jgi:enolase
LLQPAAEFATESKPPSYDIKKKATPNDGTGVTSGAAMIAMYADMAAKYPIVSIEE